ncbi:hypothetical protein GSH05_19790 [Burkholderia pseudomallei]|uniref:Uncharacterized protein n=2 Tax=Burkholderia pseudomallei TaxID=28450 RepID=A0AAX0TZ85_BURPE|nr:hypothetical protein CXQ84_01700 [Burkholderia pseudomallei]EET10189.1 conserved hypothetical protein [Burkholderia pseudomallei 1710a]KGS19605.1 hypothetical protein X962_5836 [Burkholderia pseudomallei MSHR7343]PNW99440.1 hypothetical protein CF649_24275 [Burkholderia sp. 136(2017)]PNX12388.1 hypothetical protein CF650_24895 [Burkholderia sp. 129]PNX26736.1 hypothetical protein CF647_23870 [Burkholderia sp. 117]PNX35462.1 hypothetical protein CF648_24280 [Burkholderia sp. 137]
MRGESEHDAARCGLRSAAMAGVMRADGAARRIGGCIKRCLQHA